MSLERKVKRSIARSLARSVKRSILKNYDVPSYTPIPDIGGNLLARFSALDPENDFSLVGNEIAVWKDIGSGSYNALGHTSDGIRRPLYDETGWDGVKPCVTFDGINDYLYFDTEIPYADGYDIFAVVKPAAVSGANRNIMGSSGIGGPTVTIDTAAKVRFNKQSTSVLAIYTNTLTVDTPVIVGARTTGAGAGTAAAVYKNGILEQQGALTPNLTLGLKAIGAQASGGTYSAFFSGKMAEILVYDGTLSAAQRGKVIENLRSVWGV